MIRYSTNDLSRSRPLAEKAGWDPTILAIELQHLLTIDTDFDVTITGLAKQQNLLKRVEQREARKKVRRLRRKTDSWVDGVVTLFWSALGVALIWIAYLALPPRYHFAPDWQEAAGYVMFVSVALVAASFGPWLRKVEFWISLLISSFAQAFIIHGWIVRTGSLDGRRPPQDLAVLLGPVLFLVVYGCGYFLRRKLQGEGAGIESR